MWPSEEQLSRLTKATSSVYFCTDVVLNFIGCGGRKPQDLVDVCLKYMDGIPEPSVSRPFHIYHFYHQFVSNIQPDIQPDTLRILAALGSPLSLRNARDVAHVLGIDQSRLYCVLEHLCSVLKIPPPELQDGEIEDYSVELGSFLRFIHLEYGGSPTLLQSVSHMLRSHPTISSLLNKMRWTPSQPIDHFHHIVVLRRFAQSFEYLVTLSDIFEDLPAVSRALVLVHTCVTSFSNGCFHAVLIYLILNFTIPLELHDRVRFNFQPFPVHPPKYVLLGYGAHTVLIISCKSDDDEYGEFMFYSLEMLDDI
ncbi:hypothetical protein P691DRAFT_759856 [Macrolepiota fuliginosa MF-IS2]|uniref:Uncharacterized protein n=1 Tax=Macrolepiota fuliginosa MF-IS2 TaxID=1400762 RepID=A0A9P5XE71_9AGAR|nr:hypothetical protein P691DRAFT_759856 [Macrolepiota fuliginosa MF-IS2]